MPTHKELNLEREKSVWMLITIRCSARDRQEWKMARRSESA